MPSEFIHNLRSGPNHQIGSNRQLATTALALERTTDFAWSRSGKRRAIFLRMGFVFFLRIQAASSLLAFGKDARLHAGL
jgi:hypothetical protein